MVLAAIASIVISPALASWDIVPPYKRGEATGWNTRVSVNAQGIDLTVSLTYLFQVTEVSEKETRGFVRFADLEVEGMSQEDDGEYDLRLSSRGFAHSSQSEHGDAFRRMSAPIFFLYPDKPVTVGDKWTFEYKGSQGGTFAYTCEAKAEEKVGDKEALKVQMTITEDAGDKTSSDGMYWVDKEGRVLKFEIRIKNWIVPMADGQPVDATVVGFLK
jgi:hypothetical protein